MCTAHVCFVKCAICSDYHVSAHCGKSKWIKDGRGLLKFAKELRGVTINTIRRFRETTAGGVKQNAIRRFRETTAGGVKQNAIRRFRETTAGGVKHNAPLHIVLHTDRKCCFNV